MPRPRSFVPADLPTTVVESPSALGPCLDHLATASVLGFDTEFVGEDTYRPDLCLVQVSTAEHLFVIDPFGTGPLDEFWTILLDPRRIVVAHAGREETRMCFFATGKPPANLFDVQVAAGLLGLPFPIGYAGLVQEVLGIRTKKGETLTDWRRRPLTEAQVKYAFDDVRFLIPIWKRLSERLKKLDRLGWAKEEFQVYTTDWIADDPQVEKWRRVKGLGGLSRRELAVARAIFYWREGFAARVNRPPRVLLRDDLIPEIAKREPTTADDLQTLRGLPRSEFEAILTAVRSAVGGKPSDYPEAVDRDFDPPHVATLSTLLGVVLGEYCGRMKLAPNLVATAADLKALVRARQPDGPPASISQLASGWRAIAVRPFLEAVLDGKAAIRVLDAGSPTAIAVQPVLGSDRV